jgi:hypothetical protein
MIGRLDLWLIAMFQLHTIEMTSLMARKPQQRATRFSVCSETYQIQRLIISFNYFTKKAQYGQ